MVHVLLRAANPQGIYLVAPVAGVLAFAGYLIFKFYPRHNYLQETLQQQDAAEKAAASIQ